MITETEVIKWDRDGDVIERRMETKKEEKR